MTNIAHLARPSLRQFLRLGGRLVAPAELRYLGLDERRLLGAARRDDSGDFPGDAAFREPLRRLLSSLAQEAQLNFLGRMAARSDLARLLANRRLLARDRQAYPEIAAQPIPAPLFITGLPRSGTTFLHGLLAQDPAHRVLHTWEAMYPSPPPTPATRERDRRIGQVKRQLAWLHRLAPEFRAIHPIGALLPEECLVLMSHSFLSLQFSTLFSVPSYQGWLAVQDLRPAYETHRALLQHLQLHSRGDRWLLKAPAHLWSLPALFQVYPDARLIVTHRDPLEVVASVASLHWTLRSLFSDAADPAAIGPEVSEALAVEVGRAMNARDSRVAPEARFHDVWYTDLVRDPIGTVRSIYRRFGIDLSPEAEARMGDYLRETPSNRYGRHRYTLAQFGLTPEREQERFGTYCRRYGLGLHRDRSSRTEEACLAV